MPGPFLAQDCHGTTTKAEALICATSASAGTIATLPGERATDPDRVFTTAKLASGRVLLVDSKLNEQVAQPPYQVVALGVHG